MQRVLVAGIGNIFLGDDAFGCEVVGELQRRDSLPAESVKLVDYGIRGYDLAYELLEAWETAILVDAAPRGEAAGTVYVIEADTGNGGIDPAAAPDHGQGAFQGHLMTPQAVFALVRTMGGTPHRVLVVGCEPETLGDPDIGEMGISPSVRAAVTVAADTVERLVVEALAREPEVAAHA